MFLPGADILVSMLGVGVGDGEREREGKGRGRGEGRGRTSYLILKNLNLNVNLYYVLIHQRKVMYSRVGVNTFQHQIPACSVFFSQTFLQFTADRVYSLTLYGCEVFKILLFFVSNPSSI